MGVAINRIEDLTIDLTEEMRVGAGLEDTFAALLEQMGPLNETHDHKPLPMKLEAWPGGRWYRDLGENNGHFWGVVQAIKRPTLLEICGPLAMSAGVSSNLQYRLKEADGGTVITLRHNAFGLVPADFRGGFRQGWEHLMNRVRQQAEAGKAKR
jgi:hypothetical protein